MSIDPLLLPVLQEQRVQALDGRPDVAAGAQNGLGLRRDGDVVEFRFNV
jgi:hypothetical protein